MSPSAHAPSEVATGWHEAVLTRSEPDRDGLLICVLCPFRCALADGQTGRCGVRRREGGRLLTKTFATSVEHLDAIERKPLYHVRPGSKVLTLAAPGCTFRCDYCINFRISQAGRGGLAQVAAEPVDPEAVVERAAHQDAYVALSYTEPVLAPELTLALARASQTHGARIVWKTNGFMTDEAVDLLAPSLAAVNVDLKTADEPGHRKLTGAALAPILRAIARLRERGVWVEVSTPLIPGLSDTPAELSRVARTIAAIDPDIPWHLLRFTPAYRMADAGPTAPSALAQGQAVGRAAGLRYVYVERALGASGRATRCPGCGSAVVTRTVWGLEANTLRDGRCPGCDRRIAGLW